MSFSPLRVYPRDMLLSLERRHQQHAPPSLLITPPPAIGIRTPQRTFHPKKIRKSNIVFQHVNIQGLTEKKINSDLLGGQLYQVSGLKLYRKDRSAIFSGGRNKGGGTLLYIPDHVTSRELIIRNLDGAESMWVVCNFDGRAVLVGVSYRPPWATAGQTEELFAHIEDMLDQHPNHDHVLTDDVNINLTPGAVSPYAPYLRDLSSKYRLEDKIIGPTRVTATSATKIDIMLCGPPANYSQAPTMPIPESDHSLCSTMATYHCMTPPPSIELSRFDCGNTARMNSSIQQLPV
ncbi:hypothetical protein BV898_11094 [Hypsibius exemplaris]|uniref:Endonuclease/exonuclease/phosphatase domain-containing protein n=1 Tax=Hypsibius exemplaris TaxID=2072580 RepID=A0A1W0WHR1_HYPEX|nr:hypothetical protein BV898_11094 [Hypsibius exemplaris]